MKSALIVSSAEKAKTFLEESLRLNDFYNIVMVSTGAEARRKLMEIGFDVVIINTPLSDEFGHELSLLVTQEYSSAAVLIIKSEMTDEISEKVEDYGIFIVPRPISRQFFYQALKFISASRTKIVSLESENIKLQNKIDEIRIINRAKCVLIQHLGMTESQAHRHIEKQAMDMRSTKVEVAKKILKIYEN